MLIDLHTHTYPASDDSFLSPDELIEESKKRGLDGICLTEHDYFWNPEQVQALSKRHNFLVLPGSEINTEAGHILVFGLTHYMFGMHKTSYVRQLIDDAGGVIVAAHPYRRRYYKEHAHNGTAFEDMITRAATEEVFQMCDAVEGVNGRGSAGENTFSIELSRQLGLPVTGASDAHRRNQIGTTATRFFKKMTSLEELVEELKAGRFAPEVLESADHTSPVPATNFSSPLVNFAKGS